jgi:hypothetical protein
MSGELRDLIYFDFDKAASIFSQVEGGLLKEMQESAEEAKEDRAAALLNLGFFKPELGRSSQERTSVLESRVLHHDLLTRLEEALQRLGILLNVNNEVEAENFDYSDEQLHAMVSEPSFVVAEGWASIEDYNKFDFFASNFKALATFINKCQTYGIEQSSEYKALKEVLDSAKEAVKREKDSRRKVQIRAQVNNLEQQLNEALNKGTAEDVPDWLLEGMKLFISTLMPDRINLRVYPFEQNARFEILSNLKRQCFIDSDLENVTFAYGIRPNVRLTVLGMVTSIPKENDELFDPLSAAAENSNGDEDQFETSFRGIFKAFEGFERFVRFSHYPNITIYPIAVYQRLKSPQTRHSG